MTSSLSDRIHKTTTLWITELISFLPSGRTPYRDQVEGPYLLLVPDKGIDPDRIHWVLSGCYFIFFFFLSFSPLWVVFSPLKLVFCFILVFSRIYPSVPYVFSLLFLFARVQSPGHFNLDSNLQEYWEPYEENGTLTCGFSSSLSFARSLSRVLTLTLSLTFLRSSYEIYYMDSHVTLDIVENVDVFLFSTESDLCKIYTGTQGH